MTLNGVMAVTLRYFTEYGKRYCVAKKRSVAEFMQESIVFLVRVQCRKESSRSLSHPLMSFLLIFVLVCVLVVPVLYVFFFYMCTSCTISILNK